MKKALSLLLMMAMSITLTAQIVLIPGEFTSKDGKGFVVVEQEGTQKELYDKVKSNIIAIFKNPYLVMSENKPKIITLNAVSSGISFKKMGINYHPKINYKMNIYFKDGKIRFDAPIIIGSITEGLHSQARYSIYAEKMSMTTYPVFKKDGKVRNEEMKKSMEDYFNYIIRALTRNTGKEEQGIPEDW